MMMQAKPVLKELSRSRSGADASGRKGTHENEISVAARKRKNGTRCVRCEPAVECVLHDQRETKCQLVPARQQSPRKEGWSNHSFHFLLVEKERENHSSFCWKYVCALLLY
jgi:hypothetical protein